ncbi:hypothetical protein K461DRAFT_273049 [Myriangium duriaei CBS 260.36]|uniref:Uncharacterized protein n=1 Tax=Myriangium duriaei CBS 260.36 TaxID=1168546 RepID=A0A9P4JC66_9PEZI|nr:hypothetical protein K461DRAFT_273049 [Myriangium duriaei CBS 260.36]
MWVLSCRFWFVHTVLEGVRLVREKQRVNQRARVVGEEKEEKVRAKEEQAAWYRAWYSNAGYAPMALHYSFASGLISDDVLGALGLVVAYNSFGHLWRQSAL